jgi:hypothetical protein
MSSLTKKDFSLLQDAINEGVRSLFNDPTLSPHPGKQASQPEAVGQSPAALPVPLMSRNAERAIRQHISDALCNRLKYTSDTFDAEKFKDKIVKDRALS